MTMRTKGLWALLLGLIMVVCCSCESNEVSATPEDSSPKAAIGGPSQAAAAADTSVYSRYNIHYYVRGSSNIASYANYTDCPGHNFLPYNTKFRVGSGGMGFSLTAVDTGMRIQFEYKSANMQGMPEKEYISTITSPTPVDYSGLNAQDQEGIAAGRAIVGMTKQGVMIALGYPAKHRTPSTDLNTWIYWRGRFNVLTVNFGQDGKVASIM
jgi:hypothetical protein